ncbi:hypothetical protein KEM52_004399 [Ascosphaera acerosa]|nr:hypothetical protein KEM52_004399 [Ascosphaera acerosa]
MSSPDMQAAAKAFFSAPRFAVAGASADTSKFGYKILAWYYEHSLPVTPVNPRIASITLPSGTIYTTAASPAALGPHAAQTSLSVVTPPQATLAVLREARRAGVPAVWLQPGTYDEQVVAFARREFPVFVCGEDERSRGREGWCVLVDGEDALAAAGVDWTAQKL